MSVHTYRMAARIAVRDLRGSRFKFAFVVVAIAIGVAALGGTQGCVAAFQSALSRNLREWIAADVSIRSQNPPDDDQIAFIESLERQGAKRTMVIDTIAQVSSDRVPDPQVAAAKIIDPANYPFYGTVLLRPSRAVREALSLDSVAVTEELLGRLNVAVGEQVQVNGVPLRVAAILVSEPDQLAELPTPLPRILIHSAGRAAEALRPRGMYYRTLLALSPAMSVGSVRDSLDRVFPGRRILDYRTPDPQVMWFLKRAATGLRVLGALVLLLAALGAAVAMWAHLEPRLDSVAVMKALGGRSRDIVVVFAIEMALLAGAGCVLGALGGLGLERVAARVVPQQFGLSIATGWNWTGPAIGMLVGFAAAMLLPLPVLLRAARVRPNRLLRRAMAETAGRGVTLLRAACNRVGRRRFAIRHGFANLLRPGSYAWFVGGAMTAAVAMLFAIQTIERSLLADLTENFRPGSSTLFLAGILPNQVDEVTRTLAAQPGVEEPPVIAPFFPLAILRVDGRTPQAKANEADWMQRRWLSTKLDRSASFAHIVEGSWPAHGDRLEVLLPRRLARVIGATVGSRVEFEAAGVAIEARVAALTRMAPLDSFRCCLIFNRALPQQRDSVYYGVASLRPGTLTAARVALYRAFPSVTTWDAGDAARTLETWLNGLLWTLRAAAIFALITGASMLGFAVAATQRRRIRELAVFKSLGATRARILSIYAAEFSAIGIFSGAIGSLLATLAVSLVWGRMLGGSVALPHWSAFLATILGAAAVANLGGWAAAIPCFQQRPAVLLRDE